MTHRTAAAEAGQPESCPWCGRERIRRIYPAPDGNRHYRCVACGTTFFIHVLPPHRPDTDRIRANPPEDI